MAGSYRELDASAIEATLATLERRVRERFPATGLLRVIAELRAVAAETVERIERLRAPNELRSLAHVVDMHQLTKDPEQFSPEHRETASSPVRPLTRYELARYLDDCSETLSLTSKVAALWAQRFEDAVVLGAVNEVEALTTGLSSKIWQKLSILDAARRTEAGADPVGGRSR